MNANSRLALLAASALLTLLAACATGPTSSAPVQFSGSTLVNRAGMTLYTYDKDPDGKSACTGACTTNWSPLMATAADKAGGDFSVVAREDGSRQWAYDGKPLYTWVKDQKPGDKTGDGFNKVWHTATRAAPMQQSDSGGY